MASSAPSARNALAQPQAIDWSLAMPTMRPRLPSSSGGFSDGNHVQPPLIVGGSRLSASSAKCVTGDHEFLVGRHHIELQHGCRA